MIHSEEFLLQPESGLVLETGGLGLLWPGEAALLTAAGQGQEKTQQ
jgi:hypothetical protein